MIMCLFYLLGSENYQEGEGVDATVQSQQDHISINKVIILLYCLWNQGVSRLSGEFQILRMLHNHAV